MFVYIYIIDDNFVPRSEGITKIKYNKKQKFWNKINWTEKIPERKLHIFFHGPDDRRGRVLLFEDLKYDVSTVEIQATQYVSHVWNYSNTHPMNELLFSNQ
jgi:hypothetical protein